MSRDLGGKQFSAILPNSLLAWESSILTEEDSNFTEKKLRLYVSTPPFQRLVVLRCDSGLTDSERESSLKNLSRRRSGH